jgi:hypothetical protein
MCEEEKNLVDFAATAVCVVCCFRSAGAPKRFKAMAIRNTGLAQAARGETVFNTPIQKNTVQCAPAIDTILSV